MSKFNDKKFFENYGITVLDTNKRTLTRRNVKMFQHQNNKDIFDSVVTGNTESLYTISIPESKLRALAFLDEQFYFYDDREFRENFQIIMEQKHRERILRESNEAVKAAFEHYSLLLKLAENGNH